MTDRPEAYAVGVKRDTGRRGGRTSPAVDRVAYVRNMQRRAMVHIGRPAQKVAGEGGIALVDVIGQRGRNHRRIVGPGHVHRERCGAGGAVHVGGLHREGVGIVASRQRVDRHGSGT